MASKRRRSTDAGGGRSAPGGSEPRGSTRRLTHNQSEQQRARRIKAQIDEIRELMMGEGGMSEIRSDKFSILSAAVGYINGVQQELRDLRQETRQLKSQVAKKDKEIESLKVASPTPTRAPLGGVASAICGMDGMFIDCNARFCKLTGFDFKNVFSKGMFALTRPEDMPATFKIVNELMATKEPSECVKQFNKVCIFAEGRPMSVYVTMQLVRNAKGEPVHFRCFITPTEDGKKPVLDELGRVICTADGRPGSRLDRDEFDEAEDPDGSGSGTGAGAGAGAGAGTGMDGKGGISRDGGASLWDETEAGAGERGRHGMGDREGVASGAFDSAGFGYNGADSSMPPMLQESESLDQLLDVLQSDGAS